MLVGTIWAVCVGLVAAGYIGYWIGRADQWDKDGRPGKKPRQKE